MRAESVHWMDIRTKATRSNLSTVSWRQKSEIESLIEQASNKHQTSARYTPSPNPSLLKYRGAVRARLGQPLQFFGRGWRIKLCLLFEVADYRWPEQGVQIGHTFPVSRLEKYSPLLHPCSWREKIVDSKWRSTVRIRLGTVRHGFEVQPC